MQIKDPYGFVYITTNIKNGKRYIGKKVFDMGSKWKSYLGSGVALKHAISKYGRENFKKHIVAIAFTEEELCFIEKQYINLLGAVQSEDFYNIASGGEGYDFFGTEAGDNSVHVYCVDLDMAFKNVRIAEEITGENQHTIRTKCKTFDLNYKIRKGYRWCYVDKMYSTGKHRGCYASIPVVFLGNNKVYTSWSIANKVLNENFTRRSVITYEQYIKMKNDGKNYHNRLLRLDDFFKIQEYTE